jgi:hypothetical protein
MSLMDDPSPEEFHEFSCPALQDVATNRFHRVPVDSQRLKVRHRS